MSIYLKFLPPDCEPHTSKNSTFTQHCVSNTWHALGAAEGHEVHGTYMTSEIGCWDHSSWTLVPIVQLRDRHVIVAQHIFEWMNECLLTEWHFSLYTMLPISKWNQESDLFLCPALIGRQAWNSGLEHRFWRQTVWTWILALPRAFCVILGQLLNPGVIHSPCLESED